MAAKLTSLIIVSSTGWTPPMGEYLGHGEHPEKHRDRRVGVGRRACRGKQMRVPSLDTPNYRVESFITRVFWDGSLGVEFWKQGLRC